jgi:hypothetical protein
VHREGKYELASHVAQVCDFVMLGNDKRPGNDKMHIVISGKESWELIVLRV